MGVIGAVANRRGLARHPAPGRLIEVGGHRVHLDCRGSGSITVIFESALGGWSLDWARVQEGLPSSVRSCAYDRAGYGWSEPTDDPYGNGRVVRGLRAALDAADARGPYVLVGHSVGGVYAREFAHEYPADIAGMVFVDSSHEQMLRRFPSDSEVVQKTAMLKYLRILRLGPIATLGRLGRTPVANSPDMGAEQRAIASAIGYRRAAYDALYREAAAFAANSFLPDASLHSIPDVPVVVLTSSENLDDPATGHLWRELQQEIADLVSDARIRVVGSGHFIQIEHPRTVVDAIEEVIAAASG